MTSAARAQAAASTSRRVTSRSIRSVKAVISTPSARQASATAGAVGPGSLVRNTRMGDALGNGAGVGVILGQPRHVVLQRVEAARRDDAGLAQGPAEPPADRH